jgi:hypothetical protein
MAVDEMALAQIIESAEIIEAERRAALDPDHLETWAALYRGLTPEETNTLFFATEAVRCEAGRVLAHRGRIADRLLLPDSGRLVLFYREGDRIRPIQAVEAGTPAAQESLLNRTVFTASLAARTPSVVRVLPVKAAAGWNTRCPGLIGKLRLFCEKTHQVPRLLRQQGLDRRGAPRSPAGGRIGVEPLDREGRPAGRAFPADIEDVASGGLAFSLKATETAANTLMGRPLRLRFPIAADGEAPPLEPRCRVMAVVDRHFGRFTAHCRLDAPLPGSLADAVTREDAGDAQQQPAPDGPGNREGA